MVAKFRSLDVDILTRGVCNNNVMGSVNWKTPHTYRISFVDTLDILAYVERMEACVPTMKLHTGVAY